MVQIHEGEGRRVSARPTREQIEAAREWLRRVAEYPTTVPDVTEHARTLLSATAQPTDEELAAEAIARFGATDAFADERHGYIAGARREGARFANEPSADPACECPPELPSRDRCGDGWIRCNAGLRAEARRINGAK
jgi:hypothetical protein